MSVLIGGSGNDRFSLSSAGSHQIDGGPGVDLLDLGALLRSSFDLAIGPAGTVTLDAKPGAPVDLHVVLRDLELLRFANGADTLDLRSFFGAAAGQVFDLVPPELVLASPVEQPRGTDVTADFSFTFNEPIQIGQGLLLLRDERGATFASFDIRSSPAITLGTHGLSINPPKDLPSGAHFSWHLPAGVVTDLAGNAFVPLHDLAFSTNTRGGAGNEVFSMGRGELYLNGGDGIDTLALQQPRSAYTLDLQRGESQVIAKDGSGRLRMDAVERLSFADTHLALDTALQEHAGLTALTLGAVFGPASVRARPDYVGIGLHLLDTGTTPLVLMQFALDARLGAHANPQAVVDLLYFNVMGTQPSATESAAYVALLADGSFTPASLGLMAATTALNIDHIQLMGAGGLQETGLPFSPA
jgi:Ca2+-binding RTX toxin-like protein